MRPASGLTAPPQIDPVTASRAGSGRPLALADHAEQKLLHMITSDPRRTPNFIVFANPDYFFLISSNAPACTAIRSCFSQTHDHA
jgi:hypothetical protein